MRLGHAPFSKLKSIPQVKSQIAASDQVCLVYPVAKLTKLSFPVTTSHASELFDLIHLDTWGPYQIPTREKFRYFLTVVDDKSRNTWLYLMKNKSDFLTCFQAFCQYVLTHLKA